MNTIDNNIGSGISSNNFSNYSSPYNSASSYNGSSYNSGNGSSYGGSYGNSYGGNGGYSGYGSSYGGNGGYGSSYGNSYGSSYGGNGGYGSSFGNNRSMYGNQGPMQQGNFLEDSRRYLDSLFYMLNCVTDMTRMVETNYPGLSKLFSSIFNLIIRMKGWGFSSYKFTQDITMKIYCKIIDKIKSNVILFNMFKNNKQAKVKLYNLALKSFLIMLTITLMAPFAKGGKLKLLSS